jgi:hypothetical protein
MLIGDNASITQTSGFVNQTEGEFVFHAEIY